MCECTTHIAKKGRERRRVVPLRFLNLTAKRRRRRRRRRREDGNEKEKGREEGVMEKAEG